MTRTSGCIPFLRVAFALTFEFNKNERLVTSFTAVRATGMRLTIAFEWAPRNVISTVWAVQSLFIRVNEKSSLRSRIERRFHSPNPLKS